MPAETAAAPGAPGASQSTESSAAAAAQEPTPSTTQAPLSEPIGDRAAELEMLEILNVPTEVLERARQEVEKEKAESEKQEAGTQPAPPPPAAPPAAAHEEDKVDDTWPETARQRVGKLTAKREELKGQLSEKDAEIARLKAAQPAPPAQRTEDGGQRSGKALDPTLPEVVAKLSSEEAIQQRQKVAQYYHQWAMDHSEVDDDGVVRWKGEYDVPVGTDAQGNEIKKNYSPKDIAEVARNTAAELGIHLPKRLQQVRQEQQRTESNREAEELRPKYEELALEEYPDLKNPESELSIQVAAALKLEPFKSAPDGRLAAADLLSKTFARRDKLVKAGLITLPAAGNGNGAAPAATIDPKLAPFLAPKPTRAPAVPSTAHGAPPPPSTDAEADKAREDYLKSPRTDEDYQLFVDRLSASQANRGAGSAAPARV